MADTLNLQTLSQEAELWSYRAYTPRKVVREERDILTGICGGGKEQNLVVFSDDFFDEIYQGEQLYLILAEEGDYEAADQELLSISKDIEGMSYYGRRAMIQDTETERYLKQVVWMFMLIMVGVCGIYLLLSSSVLRWMRSLQDTDSLTVWGCMRDLLGRRLDMRCGRFV